MCHDWFSNGVRLHLFQSFSIDRRSSLLANNRDAESIIEQRMQVWVASPVKMRKPNTVEYDLLKVSFEGFDLFIEFIYYLGFSSKVNSYSPQAHLKCWTLKTLAETISGSGVIIKLW